MADPDEVVASVHETPARPEPEPEPEAAPLMPEPEPGPEPERARLCSRPYGLSGTPGKGNGSREPDRATAAAETKRLARGFEVQLDALERQRWSPDVGVEFDDLDPSVSHRIQIFEPGGRRVRTLKLDFVRRGSNDICLGFDDFYSTWQLRVLRTGARCGPCVTR